MKAKLKTKKGDVPCVVIEEKYGKVKVKYSQYPDGSGIERTNWFEKKRDKTYLVNRSNKNTTVCINSL